MVEYRDKESFTPYKMSYQLCIDYYKLIDKFQTKDMILFEITLKAISMIPTLMVEYIYTNDAMLKNKKIYIAIAKVSEFEFWLDMNSSMEYVSPMEKKMFINELLKLREELIRILKATPKIMDTPDGWNINRGFETRP